MSRALTASRRSSVRGRSGCLGLSCLRQRILLDAKKGEAEANIRYALLKELPVTIEWEMNEPLLLTAARLKAAHRVSLADAMIAAYAIRREATLVHKDPEYESLSHELALEALPYKN